MVCSGQMMCVDQTAIRRNLMFAAPNVAIWGTAVIN
jgi:hypothetical protein